MSGSVKYQAVHVRVRKARGPARDHSCVDCGNPAGQWSYRHDDPNEIEDADGRQYSVDPEFYDPRCPSCHRKFDQRHRSGELQAVAIAGHIVSEVKLAVAQRKRARRKGDRQAEDFWDDELERLMAPLQERVGLPVRRTRHRSK